MPLCSTRKVFCLIKLPSRHAHRYNSAWTPPSKAGAAKPSAHSSTNKMDNNDLNNQYLKYVSITHSYISYPFLYSLYRSKKSSSSMDTTATSLSGNKRKAEHESATQQAHQQPQQRHQTTDVAERSPKKRARTNTTPAPPQEEDTFVLNAATMKALEQHKAKHK